MKYEFKGMQGTWLASTNFDNEPCVLLLEKGWSIGKTFIIETMGQEETAIADSHLCAAAPDLLNACIELHTVLDPLINNPAHEDVMKRVKSAIHKALNIQ